MLKLTDLVYCENFADFRFIIHKSILEMIVDVHSITNDEYMVLKEVYDLLSRAEKKLSDDEKSLRIKIHG